MTRPTVCYRNHRHADRRPPGASNLRPPRPISADLPEFRGGPVSTRITETLAQQFVAEYAANKSIRQIARTHRVSYGAVHRHVNLHGVTMRRPGGGTRGRPVDRRGR